MGLLDKKYCACAFDLFDSGASYTEAMGEESTSFICKGAFPYSCIRTKKEFGKGALFAGCGWSGGESGDMMSIPFVGGALDYRLVLFMFATVWVGGAAVA